VSSTQQHGIVPAHSCICPRNQHGSSTDVTRLYWLYIIGQISTILVLPFFFFEIYLFSILPLLPISFLVLLAYSLYLISYLFPFFAPLILLIFRCFISRLNLLPFFTRMWDQGYEIIMLCGSCGSSNGGNVCTYARACAWPSFQFLQQSIDYHDTWHESYATGGHPNTIIFNLQSYSCSVRRVLVVISSEWRERFRVVFIMWETAEPGTVGRMKVMSNLLFSTFHRISLCGLCLWIIGAMCGDMLTSRVELKNCE